jgi:hypothetical protein
MLSQNSRLIDRERQIRFAIRERSLLWCMSPTLALLGRRVAMAALDVSLPLSHAGGFCNS